MLGELKSFLSIHLGDYRETSKGNISFHCPFCHHRKHKLEVQLEDNVNFWHCWVCGTKGGSLFTLLKKINVKQSALDRLATLLPEKRVKRWDTIQEEKVKSINLPKEYKPLWIKNDNFYWKTAVEYLYSRGVTIYDILKYRIGYCEGGRYKNRIIFPNYDKHGNLNYFTTRTFLRTITNSFKNPGASRNVIGFELQLNPDLPIILVESALDAIILKRNACPLYGTIIPKNLKLWILENDIKDLYICLDRDAIKKSIKICEYFMSQGINVRFVELPDNKDPNDLQYEKMWELINNSQILSSDNLFKYKVRSLLN